MSEDVAQAKQTALELMRRQSGLRVDREGRFWHQGTLITHAKIQTVLAAGIGRHPTSGEFVVHIGSEWAYVEVEDAPLVVLGVDQACGQSHLRLSDGTTAPLLSSELWFADDDVLYFAARGGQMPARFSRTAFQALMHSLVLTDDGTIQLHQDGAIHTIPRRVRRT